MTLCDVIFIAGGEHTSRLPHFSESIVLKHFEAAIGRGCAHGIGDLSFKCNVSKFLCFFVGFLAGKGWRGEWKALCLSFSGQTVSEPGQTYGQFQKFLLVIDSFGPNRCRILWWRGNKSTHTHTWVTFIFKAQCESMIFFNIARKMLTLCFDKTVLKIFWLTRTDSFKIPRIPG